MKKTKCWQKIIKVAIGKNHDETKLRRDLKKIGKIEMLDRFIKSNFKNL